MKFGIGIPNAREGIFYPTQLANAAQIVELTQLAERLGYDSVWGADFMAPVPEMGIPDGKKPDWFELMVTLAYLAGVTRTIRLGAGVVVLPYRDPILLAKQAATLDHFSRGRLILGVGLGAFRTEFEAIQPRRRCAHRGKLLEEHLDALVRLLNADGPVSFSGEYLAFDNVELDPKPVQSPLPLQIAGFAPSTYRRVAKFATGLSTVYRVVENDYREIVAALVPHLEREGRSLSDIDLQFTTFQLLDRSHERAWARAKRSRVVKRRGGDNPDAMLAKVLCGNPEEAIEQIAALAARGVTHFVSTTYLTDSYDEVVEQVQLFAEEVMPAFATGGCASARPAR